MFESGFSSLVIGSLLHDIGKFWQRAEKDNLNIVSNIKVEYRLQQNKPQHQFWSAYLLKNYIEDYEASKIAENHHNPRDPYEYIVAIADKLSAEEREDREDEQHVDPSTEPLISILSQVSNIRDGYSKPQVHYQPLCGLEITPETFFPQPNQESAFNNHSYKSLWHSFVTSLNEINLKVTGEKKITQLLNLLDIFTSSIPSAAYYSNPDISLFDHTKTTAAIASCLFRHSNRAPGQIDYEKVHKSLVKKYQSKERKVKDEEDILDTQAFTLLAGDISGIQNFIYDISAKGAAKGLKGRSVYIHLLALSITKHILRKFELTPLNLLFCGGGHFYLLLPYIENEEIQDLQKKVNEVLFRAHQGALSLVIAGASLNFNDFGEDFFGKHWKELTAKLYEKKKHKFLEIIKDSSQEFFGPFAAETDLCPVCLIRSYEANEEKCHFCKSYEDLADDIIRKNIYSEKYFDETKEMSFISFDNVFEVFKAFGMEISFNNTIVEGAFNFTLNDRNFSRYKCDGFIQLPKYAPLTTSGTIKSFDELSKDAKGKKRWAILRGDVDNLGKVFSTGLENKSISRIASLSRNMESFFLSWLNRIVENDDLFKNTTYLIYAGGDDFVIMGSWDVIPVLAMKINYDFQRFVSHNPHITLSCSIFIPPGEKYPFYKASQICGDDLEVKAKDLEKNKVVFLNKPFQWEEYKEIEEVKNILVSLISKDKVPSSLLQIIYQGFIEFNKFKKGEYPINRLWLFIYSLSRLAKRQNHLASKIMELEKRVIKGHNLEIGVLYAARWAELEL
ncbi:MAG: CRISPR-associated protein Cas10/Csm1 [candidate division WS2 bacterium]|nr:CRISPR-associated protein Cas10/Csm1 [Candidatus Psychracetigena formicireducens]